MNRMLTTKEKHLTAQRYGLHAKIRAQQRTMTDVRRQLTNLMRKHNTLTLKANRLQAIVDGELPEPPPQRPIRAKRETPLEHWYPNTSSWLNATMPKSTCYAKCLAKARLQPRFIDWLRNKGFNSLASSLQEKLANHQLNRHERYVHEYLSQYVPGYDHADPQGHPVGAEEFFEQLDARNYMAMV